MRTLMPLFITRAKRKIIKNNSGLNKLASKFLKLQKKMQRKKYRRKNKNK